MSAGMKGFLGAMTQVMRCLVWWVERVEESRDYQIRRFSVIAVVNYRRQGGRCKLDNGVWEKNSAAGSEIAQSSF